MAHLVIVAICSALVAGDIAVVDEWLPAEQFVERYFKKRKPVMFKVSEDVLEKLREGVGALWGEDVWGAEHGEQIVENSGEGVEKGVLGEMVGSGRYVFDRNNVLEGGGVGEMLEKTLEKHLPYGAADCEAPEGYTFDPGVLYSRYLIAGGEGTGSPAHQHSCAMLIVLEGEKEWVVRGVNRSAGREMRFVQKPGWVTYIPERFWHEVTNVGEGVTVAVGLQSKLARSKELKTLLAATMVGGGEGVEYLVRNMAHDKTGMLSAAAVKHFFTKSSDAAATRHFAVMSLSKNPQDPLSAAAHCQSSLDLDLPSPFCATIPPTNPRYHVLRCLHTIQTSPTPHEALQCLETTLSLSDPPKMAHYLHGKVLLAFGMAEDALRSLRAAGDVEGVSDAIAVAESML